MNTKFNGSPVKLGGNFAEVGAKAPDFKMVKSDLSNFTLGSVAGKRLLLNIFPSLDTSVCAMSVRKFNKMASEIKDVLVLCISKDLPFAQKRFCTTENIANVIPLSDCRIGSTFGADYGVIITDGVLEGLFARAVINFARRANRVCRAFARNHERARLRRRDGGSCKSLSLFGFSESARSIFRGKFPPEKNRRISVCGLRGNSAAEVRISCGNLRAVRF